MLIQHHFDGQSSTNYQWYQGVGQTKKRNDDRYILAFKLQAVKLADHPNVRALDIADGLGLHPVIR
jgi:hypothetical protein